MRFALLLLLLVGLTLLRVGLSATTPLTPDEAYLELLSLEPAPGYVDGTPGAALSVFVGTQVGQTTSLTIRLTSPIYGLVASIALFFLVAKLSSTSTATWTTIVLNALPSFNYATTHAGAAAGALAGCFLCLTCMVHAREHKTPALLWLCSGFALAIAAQFAAITLWLLPAVLLYVLVTPGARRKTSPIHYLMFVAPPLVSLASLMSWNAKHEWLWFAKGTFQSFITLEFYDLAQTLLGFGGFVLVLCAISLIGLLFVAWQGLRSEPSRLLLVIGVVGAGVWIFQAMQGINEIPVGLVVFALALAVVLENLESISPIIPASAALVLVLTGTIWALPFVSQAGNANREWRHLAEMMLSASREATTAEQTPVFLVADTMESAAMLGHFIRQIDPSYDGWPPVFVRESQNFQGQYSLWPRYDEFRETDEAPDEYFEELKAENPYQGQSAIYLGKEAPDALPQAIDSAFQSVIPLEKIEVRTDADSDPRMMYLYLLRDYQTLPL